MFTLSNSQAQMWQHSPRCYWWRYVRGLVAKSDTLGQAPRTWGDFVHQGFEGLYQGLSVAESIDAMDLGPLEDLAEIGDYHTPAALRYVLDEYAKSVLPKDLERYEVLSIEDALHGKISSSVGWLGKLDLILRERETGGIFVWDHKTTSKKVDSGYWTAQFSHDQQMTSYWWLAQQEYGDDFAGLMINACQTTKTINYRHARVPVTRDIWQIDEWFQNFAALGPEIRDKLELGKTMHEAGLRETDPEVLAAFPICNTYSENFCDYAELNRTPPEIREALIDAKFTTRSGRGGGGSD